MLIILLEIIRYVCVWGGGVVHGSTCIMIVCVVGGGGGAWVYVCVLVVECMRLLWVGGGGVHGYYVCVCVGGGGGVHVCVWEGGGGGGDMGLIIIIIRHNLIACDKHS